MVHCAYLINYELLNGFVDKIDGKRESEILNSVKSQINRVLYTNQNLLHKKTLSLPTDDKTTEFEIDTSLPGLIEQLRNDLQGNSTQINKNVTAMLHKFQTLEAKVTSIDEYLSGVTIDVVT